MTRSGNRQMILTDGITPAREPSHPCAAPLGRRTRIQVTGVAQASSGARHEDEPDKAKGARSACRFGSTPETCPVRALRGDRVCLVWLLGTRASRCASSPGELTNTMCAVRVRSTSQRQSSSSVWFRFHHTGCAHVLPFMGTARLLDTATGCRSREASRLDRPSNSRDMSRSTSSTNARIARNGWSAGTRCSADT